jgi:hypothetical protein
MNYIINVGLTLLLLLYKGVIQTRNDPDAHINAVSIYKPDNAQEMSKNK